ncbi:hypothetical protein HYDPIDRAFT_182665 [Hydnomerulius pinastri MD-312]|uniref:Uncharacterized protein n=1 Tax=Hydnomerulius pinastri MD-312 TaxID=994086 RepID=A0A0C9W6Q4_9AGAM|nr:hypothetical protein HYDPIDRAFT_182665 [Hydnomerulius pinastri MD-312]
MSTTHTHHHSLEGNNAMRGTEYMEPATSGNQGIVDGRPAGRQPSGAPITLDTVVDKDASADDGSLQYPTLEGATSGDVHAGLGMPIQGMSSKELRHDGQSGRKRQGEGTEQFGQGAGGTGARRVDDASEPRWVAGKTEFRGEP